MRLARQEMSCNALHHMNDSRGEQELEESQLEKDIGVMISNDLNVSHHVNMVVSKANRMLGLILNTFTYLNLELFRSLYCTFVRSQLELAVSAWNPYLAKDKEALELVQRRATKRAPGLSSLSYEERLVKLRISSLEERRIRGDLIQQFKIVRGYDKVNWLAKPRYISTEENKPNTRGHKYRIAKEVSKINIRSNSFNNRIANNWNALPEDAVESKSVNTFKTKLDNLYNINKTFKSLKS